MTRDDIIRMAREAGLLPLLDEDCFQTMGTKNFGATKKVLERFFLAAAAAGAAAEREACAKVCEELRDDWLRGLGRYEFMAEGAYYCADEIRARGEK